MQGQFREFEIHPPWTSLLWDFFSFQLQWSLQTLCFIFCFFKASMTVGFNPSFSSHTGAYLQDKNYTYIILHILFIYNIYIFTCCLFFQVLTSLLLLPDVGHSPVHLGNCFPCNLKKSMKYIWITPLMWPQRTEFSEQTLDARSPRWQTDDDLKWNCDHKNIERKAMLTLTSL